MSQSIKKENLSFMNIQREKDAKFLAEMGFVKRIKDKFSVGNPKANEIFLVWRGADGGIMCNCAEFTQNAVCEADFRCKHIIAVKFALELKNSEFFLYQENDTPRKNIEKVKLNSSLNNIAGEILMGNSIQKNILRPANTTMTSSRAKNNVVTMTFGNDPYHSSQSNIEKQTISELSKTVEIHKTDTIVDILDVNLPNWSFNIKILVRSVILFRLQLRFSLTVLRVKLWEPETHRAATE